ncbi:hypothetical protein C5E45_19995 [Nocardia nova]|uniref:TauD/TfdA-like domain-containing protein n=1 Tax=Nocardia nova TaxID=37330 RepID=A0A2S6AM89_9NOCA|nr:TauD/TfdA family dioxygenase [Nocardia nova]PPJ36338.1 hypothetical protein C5E45_19995 [Nocardia nova]
MSTDAIRAIAEYERYPDRALADAAGAALADTGIARLSGFRADVRHYIGFLTRFGIPLSYYGDSAGSHPDEPAIWRIRYEPHDAAQGRAHAVDGPLAPHSSQSLRMPRPPVFAMLMVNQGWQDGPAGHNGESLLVAWADALRVIADDSPAEYEAFVRTLSAHVPHPGGTPLPVAYRLPSQRHEFDLGIRLNSGLLEHLRATAPQHPALAAVEVLVAAAHSAAHRVQLASGDLVLLDNNRWGHGRESVRGQTTDSSGRRTVNPRELWSVTIA